jgi:bacillithiol biosynthesis deacetylase BshB1
MANILVIGPHPDDQEIGMGGTIALLAAQGHNILLCDMTDGCPTPIGDRPTRLAEAAAAVAELAPAGKPLTRVLLDLPNRRVQHTLEARHMVAGLIRAHQATIVFCPHPEDAHPDHLATTRIVEDARFDAKLTKIEMPVPPGFETIGPPLYPKWLFYYYCSHLRRVPDPSFLIDTTTTHEAKIRAILAYKSQFIDHAKNQGVVEWLRAQDLYLGSRIGTRAAEGFWTREPIGLGSITGFVDTR